MKIKQCDKIFSYVLLLFPILHQYSVGVKGITLGEIILLGASFLCFINGKNKIRKEVIPFTLFTIFTFVLSTISLIYQDMMAVGVITRMIRYAIYFLVIILFYTDFKIGYVYKVYTMISMSIATYMVLQTLVYNATHIILTNKILPLPWYAAAPGLAEMAEGYEIFAFQPRGIFTEQGFAAHYLLPCLTLLLYGKKEKNNVERWIKIGVILIALFLSRSGQGIMILFVIAGWFFVRGVFNLNVKQKRIGFFMIMPVVAAFIIFMNTSVGQFMIEKIFGRFFSGGSTSMRLARGYAVYFELPPLMKLIGVGAGNLDEYVFQNGITTIFDPKNMTSAAAGYVNGLSSVFLNGGFIGGILFLFTLGILFKTAKAEYRMCVVLYFIFSLVEGTVFVTFIIFYMMIIFSGIQEQKYLSKEVEEIGDKGG